MNFKINCGTISHDIDEHIYREDGITMIKLGEYQVLTIVKKTEFGVYLAENETDAEKVLLPIKQVRNGAKPGDRERVFIYRDSDDRLIATINTPKLTVGETAVLKVNDITKIGAFLDWGLERDILLPFKEMTDRVRKDSEYLVALYIDKSHRLAATMKVYKYLKIAGDYEKDDDVEGIIYEINDEIGAFVAIDYQYHGLIPKKEIHEALHVGDMVKGRVTDVRADGKINMSIHQKAYLQMSDDGEKILAVIREYDGILPYNDKASPEVIYRDFQMSKAAFKRAVGGLYKAKRIELTDKNIKLVQ